MVRVEDWMFWDNDSEPARIPELLFLPSRSKRRMSLLSRISLHIGHSLMENKKNINDVIFASRFGEITRQLSITNSILDDGEVSPAAFSHSVFNTPVALLSLTKGLTGLTRAVYSGENSLINGLLQSLLVMESNEINQLLFIMADEPVPEYYQDLSIRSQQPLAIGMVLTTHMDSEKDIILSLPEKRITEDSGKKRSGDLPGLQKWFNSSTSLPFVLYGEGFTLAFKRSKNE